MLVMCVGQNPTHRTNRSVNLTVREISPEIWLTSCRKTLYVTIRSSGRGMEVQRKCNIRLGKTVPGVL